MDASGNSLPNSPYAITPILEKKGILITWGIYMVYDK
jgi:hypothetical protein